MNRLLLLSRRTCKTYQGKVFEFSRPKRLLNTNQEVGFGWIQFDDGETGNKFVYFNEEEIVDGQKSALFTTSQPSIEFALGERPVKSHLHPNGNGNEVTTAVSIKITAPGLTPRVDRLAAQFKYGSSTPEFPHFTASSTNAKFDESRADLGTSIWGLNTAQEEEANWERMELAKKSKIDAIEAAAAKIAAEHEKHIELVKEQREAQRRSIFQEEFSVIDAEAEKSADWTKWRKSNRIMFNDKEARKHPGIRNPEVRKWVMERHWTKKY